jgi:hypothetical protein
MKTKYTIGLLLFGAAVITTLILVMRKQNKTEDDFDWIMW